MKKIVTPINLDEDIKEYLKTNFDSMSAAVNNIVREYIRLNDPFQQLINTEERIKFFNDKRVDLLKQIERIKQEAIEEHREAQFKQVEHQQQINEERATRLKEIHGQMKATKFYDDFIKLGKEHGINKETIDKTMDFVGKFNKEGISVGYTQLKEVFENLEKLESGK